MTSFVHLGLALFVIAALWAVPASAQRCVARAHAVERLAKKYSEVLVADGLGNGGGKIEVFASLDGATWTILVTFPNGVSCFVDAGVNWQMKGPGQPIGER